MLPPIHILPADSELFNLQGNCAGGAHRLSIRRALGAAGYWAGPIRCRISCLDYGHRLLTGSTVLHDSGDGAVRGPARGQARAYAGLTKRRIVRRVRRRRVRCARSYRTAVLVYVAPMTCRRGDRRPRALPVCLEHTGGAFTVGLRAWSVGASLVDPSPADAPAGVLPWRYRPAATAAALPGGTRSVTLPSGRVRTDPAEPDRAGAGHGQPQTARAEMLQMRLAYPLADRDPLPAVPRCVPACATSPAHNGQPSAAAPALALSHLDPLQSRYAGLAFSPPGLQPPYRQDGHRIAAPSTRRYRLAGSWLRVRPASASS